MATEAGPTASHRGRGTALTVCSALLFSTSGWLATGVMDAGWSPAQVACARIGLAALIMLPMVALIRGRALRLRRREAPLVLAMGLLGVAGVQLCYFIAVSRISVGIAMVLEYFAPVLVALWIRVVRRSRLRRSVWLGIGLAVIGLAMLAQVWQGLKLDPIGFAAGLTSAFCTAGYYLMAERGAEQHDPIGLTTWSMVVGAVLISLISAPWTLPFHLLGVRATLGGWHPSVWLLIVLIAVVSTALAYLTGIVALKWVSSTVASVLGLIEPLLATVAAWLLLGQSLGEVQIVGVVVLLGGAALVQLTSGKPVPGPDPLPAQELVG
ncbi:MAG TPA: EamA family transporter [Pseudonocardiaceae bacterium]|nr:EamA family transporter [Pseudonocardiaceae bacterium]